MRSILKTYSDAEKVEENFIRAKENKEETKTGVDRLSREGNLK